MYEHETIDFDKLPNAFDRNKDLLSHKLITRLSSRLVSPIGVVDRLAGEKIKVINPNQEDYQTELIGEVISYQGRTLSFLPQIEKRYYPDISEEIVPVPDAKPISIEAYFITDDPYGVGHVDFEDESVKWAVHNYLPNRVYITNGDSVNVHFHCADQRLSALLEKSITAIPSIETLKDLTTLTDWTYRNLPYKQGPKAKPNDYYGRLPVGTEIDIWGTVCRSIASIALARVEIAGLSTIPISSEVPGIEGKHLFFGIDQFPDILGRVISDPTWNVCGTYPQVREQLEEKKLSLSYHTASNTTDLHFEPDWA